LLFSAMMLLRLTHYLTALTFLAGMAVIYRHTVAIWLQAPLIEQVDVAARPDLPRDESLNDLFAESAWQRGPCKRLQTSNGMLLFQNWTQTANDEWKLWPITVILGRGMSGSADQSPVIIEADQGAEIKFTKSLNVMSGGAPPIQRGRMIGNVHIYRSDDVDQARSLDIQTANVGIDKRKIWTTEAIQMSVGQARLVGRDLTIHLSGPARPQGGNSETILDRMELIYLDQLTIPLDKGGLWKQQADQGDAAVPALVSIECGGRVEYDFAFDQLTLRDSVSLIHQVPNAAADRFDCELLELSLNDPTNDSIDRQGPMDWLVEIVATGMPAVVTLPGFDVELAAERIRFNALDGIVEADGERGIRVRRGRITARLAALIYQFDPKRPKILGAIDAPGAGIVTIDDPEIDIRRAEWTELFRMAPAGLATTDNLRTSVELRVDGDFHAWLTDGGEFQADSITGFLKPDPQSDSSSRVALIPDRFAFDGNVRVDTAAIKAETKYLELEFVENDALAAQSAASPMTPVPDDGPATRQWLTQPGQSSTMVAPVARPRPIIRGDLVRAQVWRNGSKLTAKNLTVTGSVEVEHVLETAGQVLPARLSGEALRLIDGGGEDILVLEGGDESTARLEIGDGFFVGPQIQVRPKANIVWINSAGEFQMPTAALPTGLAGETNPKMRWTKPPHCRWNGEMLFDGRQASLSDGVDITASLVNGQEPWDLQMTGDELQLSLLEGVQVTDMQTMREATVQRISLNESTNRPVMVEALQRSPDGVLQAKHLIHAAKLSFAPSGGGKIIGDGPGWYRGWLRPQKDDDPVSAGRATMIDGGDTELSGIHLIFSDSMQAHLTDRSLEFRRGVRVGVRPVTSWDEAFDASTMDAISLGDSTLDCDRLRFTVEPGFDPSRRVAGAPTPWEMEATRGVVFRTRNDRGLLEGTASRASYASSKDLFTIDGGPNRAATFRQTRPDGTAGPDLAVRSMTIRPKSMILENMILERLHMAEPTGGLNFKR
jgi:hypothetical protein